MAPDITEIPYIYPEMPEELKKTLYVASEEIAERLVSDMYDEPIPFACYDGIFAFMGEKRRLFSKTPVYGEIIVDTERTYDFAENDIASVRGKLVTPERIAEIEKTSDIAKDHPRDADIDWDDIIEAATLSLQFSGKVDFLRNPPRTVRLYKVIISLNHAKDAFVSCIYFLDFPVKKALKSMKNTTRERM